MWVCSPRVGPVWGRQRARASLSVLLTAAHKPFKANEGMIGMCEQTRCPEEVISGPPDHARIERLQLALPSPTYSSEVYGHIVTGYHQGPGYRTPSFPSQDPTNNQHQASERKIQENHTALPHHLKTLEPKQIKGGIQAPSPP